jgi:protein phosphatase
VGDSRLYHLHGDRLEPVTRDHSVVQELIESGQITEEEARSHPRRHFITRALGVKDSESGEYDELDLEPGDRLLLCTDGLTNMVEPDAICAHMHIEPAEEAVSALIQAALDGGGTDNITAVLLTVD